MLVVLASTVLRGRSAEINVQQQLNRKHASNNMYKYVYMCVYIYMLIHHTDIYDYI